MNKKASKPPPVSSEKTAFRKTGEFIGTIGFHLAETGGKVISSVSEEFSIVKNAIKKKLANKKTARTVEAKKIVKTKIRKKKTAKTINKAAKQIVERTAKKSGKTNKKI